MVVVVVVVVVVLVVVDVVDVVVVLVVLVLVVDVVVVVVVVVVVSGIVKASDIGSTLVNTSSTQVPSTLADMILLKHESVQYKYFLVGSRMMCMGLPKPDIRTSSVAHHCEVPM